MLDHAIDLARTATSLWDATGNDTSYLRGLQRVAILLAAKEDYGSAIDNNNRIIDFISSKGDDSYQIQLGWAQLRNATCYQNSYMWEFSLMKLEETKLFGPASSHMGNTWYYSLKALALYELDRHEEALGVADTGLSLTGNDDVDEDTIVANMRKLQTYSDITDLNKALINARKGSLESFLNRELLDDVNEKSLIVNYLNGAAKRSNKGPIAKLGTNGDIAIMI
jgi:tetratricopeptide (TPR) repeat protein